MGVHKDENEWSRKQTTAIVPSGVDHLDNLAISDGFVAYSYTKEGQFFINIMYVQLYGNLFSQSHQFIINIMTNGPLYSQSLPYAEKITSLAWSTKNPGVLKVGFSQDASSPKDITSVHYVDYMQRLILKELVTHTFESTDRYKLEMSGVNTMEELNESRQRIRLGWVAPHCVMKDHFERRVQLDAWQLVKNAGFKPEHEEYENISSNKMCMSTDDSTQQIYFSAGLQIYRFGYDVVVNKWNTPY
jgi:hypothetical protein